MNNNTIDAVEEFTKEDLNASYSPLCKVHLFGEDLNSLEILEEYKRVQAKIYMRLIFIMDKDTAKEISKEVTDRNFYKISNMLSSEHGWKSVTLHMDIFREKEEHKIENKPLFSFSLKNAYIVPNITKRK